MSRKAEHGLSAGSTLATVENAESSDFANSSHVTTQDTVVVTVEEAALMHNRSGSGANLGTDSPCSGNGTHTNGTSLVLHRPWDRTYGQVLRLSGVPEKGCTKKREWVYACSMSILVVGWAVIHFIAVIDNDVNMSGKADPGHYKPLYVVAFICPQLDGMLNVIFAHYVVQAGVRLKVRFCHVLNDVACDVSQAPSENKTVWWLLAATMILVTIRFIVIWNERFLLLACGSLVEFIPHVPTLLLLVRQLHGNGVVLNHLLQAVKSPRVQIEHLAELYEHFFEFTRCLCRRWQIMIVFSLALELYAAVFQSIWIRWGNEGKKHLAEQDVVIQISLQVLIQTSFMLFKIWPMAAFNAMVAKFPNRALRATAQSESQRQAGQVLAGLFSTAPPTFTLLHFTPSWQMIILMIISSLASQFSRYAFQAFSGGLAYDLSAAS